MTLKLGMVGGGRGAFIAGVHRMEARLDDQWEMVAGALSGRPRNRCGFGRGSRLETEHLLRLAGHGGARGGA